MKKTLVILAIIMASSSVSFAQRAIGLRTGTAVTRMIGTELSYEQPLNNNRYTPENCGAVKYQTMFNL